MNTTLTVPAKYLLAALICAPKYDVRYYLIGVRVEVVNEVAHIVSTNGTCLFVAKVEVPDATDAEFIIPRQSIVDLALTRKQEVNIALVDDEITLHVDCGETVTCKPLDGQYPPWRHAVPATVQNEQAQFDPRCVYDFGCISALVCGRKEKVFHIHIGGNDTGPALVNFPSDIPCFGVLMPIYFEHADYAARLADILSVEPSLAQGK